MKKKKRKNEEKYEKKKRKEEKKKKNLKSDCERCRDFEAGIEPTKLFLKETYFNH